MDFEIKIYTFKTPGVWCDTQTLASSGGKGGGDSDEFKSPPRNRSLNIIQISCPHWSSVPAVRCTVPFIEYAFAQIGEFVQTICALSNFVVVIFQRV